MRVAYLDEFPWQHCNCGWVISVTTIAQPCAGCGKVEATSFRDRFGNIPTEKGTFLYLPEK